MATKKIELGLNADDFTVEKMIEKAPEPKMFVPANNLTVFAIAALQSLDWNQIGMGVDQAAQLCWKMAEAMERNKP